MSRAQEQLLRELFAWQQPRPAAGAELAVQLRRQLERGLAALGADLAVAATSTGRDHLLVTKARLDRLVCDGLALDPAPYGHTRSNVRGTLAHKALERDLDGAGHGSAQARVQQAWRELAMLAPGDPGSVSSWLNACPPDEASSLRGEVTDLITRFREVWPTVPAAALRLRTERRIEVPLAEGLVRLQGTPDLVIDSRHRDDRARTLVIDFKTGRPRATSDRNELRFYALLAALDAGRLPFRWASFYVAECRAEVEDARADVLEATVRRVLDAVAQAAHLVAIRAGTAVPRLQGGMWCRNCLRIADCPEAVRPAT